MNYAKLVNRREKVRAEPAFESIAAEAESQLLRGAVVSEREKL